MSVNFFFTETSDAWWYIMVSIYNRADSLQKLLCVKEPIWGHYNCLIFMYVQVQLCILTDELYSAQTPLIIRTLRWLAKVSVLTLYAPIVSKINFLPTISIDCQKQSLRELIK